MYPSNQLNFSHDGMFELQYRELIRSLQECRISKQIKCGTIFICAITLNKQDNAIVDVFLGTVVLRLCYVHGISLARKKGAIRVMDEGRLIGANTNITWSH